MYEISQAKKKQLQFQYTTENMLVFARVNSLQNFIFKITRDLKVLINITTCTHIEHISGNDV